MKYVNVINSAEWSNKIPNLYPEPTYTGFHYKKKSNHGVVDDQRNVMNHKIALAKYVRLKLLSIKIFVVIKHLR